jgi:tetratricopeptide (TPR) repeat protein
MISLVRVFASAVLASVVSSAAAIAGDASPGRMAMPGSDTGGRPMTMMLPPVPPMVEQKTDKPGAPLFDGYGDHHHPITTSNPKTQAYFDQGVRMLFAFNQPEAIRSFREAARLDPSCAMCWWGVAFALGPNINQAMHADATGPAWQAVEMARALEPHASPEEVAWIEAVAARYASDPPTDRAPLDEAFARAMRRLWMSYPQDLDAAVFAAEAMMDTQPWDLWSPDGTKPKGYATDIVSSLESVIRQEPLHPGALHLYIHAVEGSSTPERAEKAADALETLMPGAGHIVHMPSHIYFRVGRYADSMAVNLRAANTDEAYAAACRAQGYLPLGYYFHDIDVLWTSAEMAGNYGIAIDAADRVVRAEGSFPQPLQWDGPADTALLTYLRFGKWDDVLSQPRPGAKWRLATAMWLYAQGFAAANTHDFTRASRDRSALADMVARNTFAADEPKGNSHLQMAETGLSLLDGEIARLNGRLDEAVADFGKARALEQALPYGEPPTWHEPVSHILGAALLEAGRAADAETVYRDSLNTYRADGWALFGLAEALNAEGKKDEASRVREEFARAWRLSDVTLASSRF